MFFHTFVGASLVATISAIYGRRICMIAIDIWNQEMSGAVESRWLITNRIINKTSAWVGALTGAWSHLLLDSFMHNDIKPLSPFTDTNLLLGLINVGWLHVICVGLGLIGFLLLIIKRI